MSHRTKNLWAYLERLKRQLDGLETRSRTLSRYRQATMVLGGLLAVVGGMFNAGLGWVLLAIVILGFGVLVWGHRRIASGIRRRRLWLQIKTVHQARIDLDWEQLGAHSPPADADHPFGNDLNVVGPRSLQQLIDVSVSQGGNLRLRQWLLETAPQREHALKRRTLIRELKGTSLFRDKLSLHAMLASRDKADLWEGDRLLRWLRAGEAVNVPSRLIWGLSVLAGVNVVLFLLNQLNGMPGYWVFTFIPYAAIYLLYQSKISPLLHEAAALEQALSQFAGAFSYLESRRYVHTPALVDLLRPLLGAHQRPSVQLKHIARVTSAASVRGNPLVWLILNVAVPWDLLLFNKLQRCKQKLADGLPQWLEVWYDLEALNSLAGFADLNPEYVFPTLIEENETATVLTANGLGHPLIPKAKKVRNDFSIDRMGRVTLITGSNMSGKSTFLRTLGINLCLAFVGAPVNAKRFESQVFEVFTSIQLSDSLADGFSFFYAEVRRLKRLLDRLQRPGALPLFFLIDEIFRGTNNRERLIGSRAYVRALVDQRGCGAISTHDLELVQLEAEFDSIDNRHFRESIEHGKMKFDYTLHPGPCPTTNALHIMRLEGLPVEAPEVSVD